MKILATLLTLLATFAFAGAQQPAVTTISVAEEKNPQPFKIDPPSKCHGIEHKSLFKPTIVFGSDTAGKTLTYRFYKIDRVGSPGKYTPSVSMSENRPISDSTTLHPVDHDYKEWKCSCCSKLKGGELLGWYAELRDGDKIVAKTKSQILR